MFFAIASLIYLTSIFDCIFIKVRFKNNKLDAMKNSCIDQT